MRQIKVSPIAILAASAIALPGCGVSVAQAPAPAPNRTVELVVYSDDFALVQETREVELGKGTTRIGVQDVSQLMDQNSVVYTWPSAKDTKIRSSTYEMGTNDSAHLLQRFLGREIELVYRGDNGREGDRQKGILQVADTGNVVVKVGDQLIVNPNATIEVPASSGVVTIPQLSAEVESGSSQKTRMGVSYLTRGLSWSADYTATLAPDATKMGLECWGTVTNTTGTEYKDAKLSFVAGSPNRAAKHKDQDYLIAGQANDVSLPERNERRYSTVNSRFGEPVTMGELHAYPYKVAATIRPDQMNRVRMMGSDNVAVTRDYAIRLSGFDSYNFYGRPEQRLKATLSLKFKNSTASGLGLPLPGGALRVYEPNDAGTAQYIGAATISDTPTDSVVSATMTDVFDIYAQTKLVATKKVDRRTVSRQVEVLLHNEKSKDVEVRLVQDFWGKWKIGSENEKSKKLNANANQWIIKIPKGSTKKLVYTVLLGS